MRCQRVRREKGDSKRINGRELEEGEDGMKSVL